MLISRRCFLAGATAIAARAQTPPRAHTGPILCLFSRTLPEIEYPELGPILNGLGFDGCDLSVQPDGTVKPSQTAVDMVRAVESLNGDGQELPVITTGRATFWRWPAAQVSRFSVPPIPGMLPPACWNAAMTSSL
jgi:hypothetical protein